MYSTVSSFIVPVTVALNLGSSVANSFVAALAVTVTFLFSIVSFPFFVLTVNCAVTSLLAASLTTAVPITVEVYSPAFVPFSFALSPLTVYVCPFTVNSNVSKPLTLFSSPSYFTVLLFASTVISYFLL